MTQNPLTYLKALLRTDKFSRYPELTEFFCGFEQRLFARNDQTCRDLLSDNKTNNREDLLADLNREIFAIEQKIQHEQQAHDFSLPSTIGSIHNLAQKYLKPFAGFFLTRTAAQRLITRNPLTRTQDEIGVSQYESTDPLALVAMGRYAEPETWNQNHLELLTTLTPDDFEQRPVTLVIVDHSLFHTAADNLIRKKCFNTHDKIVGAHVVATLPMDFDLSGKAPVLRTLTKMFHYHKEMAIFSQATHRLAQTSPLEFGMTLSKILRAHVLEHDAPLFNTFEVLEGLANREINKIIFSMAHDYPELRKWALIHNHAHLLNDRFTSFSLWRLTAWHLNGTHEHTIKMYRDDLLAEMLIALYGEENVEEAVISALTDLREDVWGGLEKDQRL